MKKFLLILTLLFGFNYSINSSYSAYFSKGAKTAGLLLTTAAGTMIGGWPVQNDFQKFFPALGQNDTKINQLSLQVAELVKNNNTLVNQLSSLGKKEDSFLDKFGTMGPVLGALLTGYRYVQYADSEIKGFLSILNLAGALHYKFKNNLDHNQRKTDTEVIDEETIEKKPIRNVERITPEQRREFLRKHGITG